MIRKYQYEIKSSKSGKTFCNRSCAASYNNTHKTSGTKISKLEKWLHASLVEQHPNLEFHFNKKDTICSELDIYLPSLKLAIELNGVCHYEPIFGKEKLDSIQLNDQRKFQTCLKQGIELYIIDTRSMKQFNEPQSVKYLDFIKDLIGKKISQE